VPRPMYVPAPPKSRARAFLESCREAIATFAAFALMAVVLTIVAVACQPGGAVRQVSAPSAPASTGVTETGPVTLTIWDQESGPTSRVWDQLTQEFEAKYPNVTVNRVHENLDELKTLLKLALLPRWLTSADFRLAFTSGVSANKVCFERELLDHYRLVFERL